MTSSRFIGRLVASAAALWALLPEVGLACSVCFGDPQAPVTKGTNLAILALLGITLGVLGGFVGFMVYLARKSAQARLAETEQGDESLEETVSHRRHPRHRAAQHGPRHVHSTSAHGSGRGRSWDQRRRIIFPDES